MGGAAEREWLDALGELLTGAHLFQPDELAGAVDAVMSKLGIRTYIYLVDHEQRALRPVPQPDRAAREPLPIDGSVPGRAFALLRSLPAAGGGWWVPLVDGTDRLGVIEFSVSRDTDPGDCMLPPRCEMLAGLVGHLITVTTPKGDHLAQARRSQPMSTGAELLWQMLPPLTTSGNRLVVSAILEPCYDVGGDGFDYAIDGVLGRMVILDAVGHGLKAGLACTVAVAAIRAARRAGHGLYAQARSADAALLEQFDDARFATAVLAELNLDTGALRYINAGHPAPLLLRAGKLVRELSGGRRMPLGLDDPTVRVGEEMLEPGDRLLLYTDGVTEARAGDGSLFGVHRLVELAEHHHAAGLPAPETLRRLAHAVSAHQPGPPADDATLLLAQWSRTAAGRTVP